MGFCVDLFFWWGGDNFLLDLTFITCKHSRNILLSQEWRKNSKTIFLVYYLYHLRFEFDSC
jgi:hypothetical protein